MSDHSGDDLVARGKTIVDSGKHAPARGELLGTITGWGLDVYEGSPQQWRRIASRTGIRMLTEHGKQYMREHHPDRYGIDGAEAAIEPDWQPPPDEWKPPDDDQVGDDEPTTWEPLNLTPWMNGEITQPEPSLGARRSDGVCLLYPGREHAVLGETESGKTWLALGCVAAELTANNHVVYIHYEEGDPGSTLERLRLLDVDPAVITRRLRFVAPSRAVRTEWITPLLQPAPTVVVHDGVNEAMSLIGADIMAADPLKAEMKGR
jgi:hypothetical protein